VLETENGGEKELRRRKSEEIITQRKDEVKDVRKER
jgi:hypothetical protein